MEIELLKALEHQHIVQYIDNIHEKGDPTNFTNLLSVNLQLAKHIHALAHTDARVKTVHVCIHTQQRIHRLEHAHAHAYFENAVFDSCTDRLNIVLEYIESGQLS